jgi:hypothetical protein
MDITFTGMFSGFRVANFIYNPIGVKQGHTAIPHGQFQVKPRCKNTNFCYFLVANMLIKKNQNVFAQFQLYDLKMACFQRKSYFSLTFLEKNF